MKIDDARSIDGSFDVAVIGGGVNGTGVARDLSLRGIKVVLFERNDLAFGASGNSSGMIHGGPRYHDNRHPNVTRTIRVEDSGFIQADRAASSVSHAVPRMPFRTARPQRAHHGSSSSMRIFRAYDDYQPLKRGEKPHVRLTPEEAHASSSRALVGKSFSGVAHASTSGAWMEPRLCTS